MKSGDASNAEYYWMNCEICNSPLKNGEAVISLARERHILCLHEMGEMHQAGISAGLFWKEMTMSACFFATVIVKKCKDSTSIPTAGVPFWVESGNILSSTIQLLEQRQSSPTQTALLWCLEMKFVDCLYYVFQMMMDQSSSLEENEVAFIEAVKLVKKYNLRFGILASSMFRLKKFAEDVVKKTGGKRDEKGTIVLTVEENVQFEEMKGMVSREMKAANEAGGAERHGLAEQLSYQVEFVNFDTYGKHVAEESRK
jgi:hypothetical protein